MAKVSNETKLVVKLFKERVNSIKAAREMAYAIIAELEAGK